jgi:hypothetical protein
MDRPAFVPAKWRKPSPLGYGTAIDSLGSVASPLLAGFSLTSVIVVSVDSDKFRWPGAVLLALTVAAVTFIGSVQCAYNSRQYLWSGAEVRDWWPEMDQDTGLERQLRGQQAEAYFLWEAWAKWTRWTFNCGILALLVGLGMGLAPKQGNGTQENLRWVALGIAFAACAGEVSWLIVASSRRSAKARRVTQLPSGSSANV